jgi:hypothetical protein
MLSDASRRDRRSITQQVYVSLDHTIEMACCYRLMSEYPRFVKVIEKSRHGLGVALLCPRRIVAILPAKYAECVDGLIAGCTQRPHPLAMATPFFPN